MTLKSVVIVLLSYYAVICISSASNTSPWSPGYDYSWRDYNGIVPLDAVQGGKDTNENSFYIGQGYFHGVGLIPGTLYPGSTNLTITAGQRLYTVFEYIKILVSPHPLLFKWIRTSSTTIDNFSKKCHLVLGGTEAAKDVYIGRTVHEGQRYAGKIYIYPPPELCLPINGGDNEIRYKNYEVLTYDCLDECGGPSLDVRNIAAV